MIKVMDMSSGEICDENLHEFGAAGQTPLHRQWEDPRPQLQLALQEFAEAKTNVLAPLTETVALMAKLKPGL